MSINEATHKSACGKWWYKVVLRTFTEEWHSDAVDVYFWDACCSTWRESLMKESQLTKIK